MSEESESVQYLHSLRGAAPEPLRLLVDAELDQSISGDVASLLESQAGLLGKTPADQHDYRPIILGFRVGKKIGAGGQGAVFEAVQLTTGQRVAIKILGGGPFISSDTRRRLEQEVSALARVSHANVVKIIDHGRTSDDSWYVALHFVEGISFESHVARLRDAKDPRPLLEFFVRVVAAVDAIHAAGVVHRDLKPSNLLIDQWNEPQVIDFGLSRSMQDEGNLALTKTGQILGSLPWMSPEQARGQPAAVDARSDVYVLGFLLFFALTGGYPYTAAGTISDILHAVLHADPEAAVRWQIRPKTIDAAALRSVILQCLAKAPEHRYGSAGALRQDIERLLADKPVAAKRRWSRRRLLRTSGRLMGACVGAIALVEVARNWSEDRINPIALPNRFNSIGLNLVKPPAGSFRMGSLPDEPGHTVEEPSHLVPNLPSLWVGTTVITRQQYAAIMAPATNKPVPATEVNLPAVNVSWYDAVEFCRRLSARENLAYRLPTEAEWEYTCRACETGPFSGTRLLKSMGWYHGNSGDFIHPVGLKSPNAWGLFDCHGNVGEWCDDEFAASYVRQLPETIAKVIRGGDCQSPLDRCRSAARAPADPTTRFPLVGFRVVHDEPAALGSASKPT